MNRYLFLLAIALSLSVQAQRRDFELFSKHLAENQSVWVQLPEEYDSTSAYGVLYVLDADGHFNYMANYVAYLSKPFAKTIPKLIVVGIRSKSPAYRFKNFTPPGLNKPAEGNADGFLTFLTQELIPAINSRYKTNETRVLAGHSLGGLLALYSIYKNPGTFTHVIAASPSLPYGDGKLLSLFSDIKDPRPMRIFFSAAENDLANYGAFATKFREQLKATNWHGWEFELVTGTDHYSTAPVAFYKGLISVFK